MYCTSCGAAIDNEARFCRTCGAAQPGVTASAAPPLDTPQFSAYTATVSSSAEYAGFWRRFGALLVDVLVLVILQFAVAFGIAIVGAVVGVTDFDSLDGLFSLIGICVAWLYFAVMESSDRQATVGKSAIGIIVTDARGNRLTFGRATGRYFAKYLSYITLLIGFIIAGFTTRKQALHDLIADTVVVMKK